MGETQTDVKKQDNHTANGMSYIRKYILYDNLSLNFQVIYLLRYEEKVIEKIIYFFILFKPALS